MSKLTRKQRLSPREYIPNKEGKVASGMKNIVLLGFVSFFADISSEMVYPLIPLYLTAAFGATPALVGIIEGIAESLASLLKVFSGYISDRYSHKKHIAFLGYSTGIFYKLALLLAGSWVGILSARIIDRFGKGIRTAPRDVLVAESARKGQMGKAFGIHKALDMAGSAIGILIAFFMILKVGDDGYKQVFLCSIIPIAIALCIFFFIHEKKATPQRKEREQFWKNIDKLDGNLKLYLLVAFIFTLGNSSNTFLLLRASDMGFSGTDVILLYFLYNLTASILSIPLGKLSDKVGRKKLLVGGYILFSFVYLGFAFPVSKLSLVVVFIAYGLYTAMTAGVERAFISEISPAHLKGTMLGLHSTLVGIALLPASAVAGLLWNSLGAPAPFVLGSGLALIAAAVLGLGLKSNSDYH